MGKRTLAVCVTGLCVLILAALINRRGGLRPSTPMLRAVPPFVRQVRREEPILSRRLALSLVSVVLTVVGCASSPAASVSPSATAVIAPSPTATNPFAPTVEISPSATAPASPSPSRVPPTSRDPTATVPPATPPASLGDTRFGACFFSPKLNVTDLPCSDLQKIGIRNTFFGAWWGQIESQPGQYDWGSVDEPVDAALACGVEPVIKISAGPGPGQDSTPPEDLGAYSRFVAALAEHLRGRVRAYAIENEINNGRMVLWTGDAYGPVRAAAYAAIKGADPGASVLDGGLTMQAYLPAKASELVQAGQTKEAIAMLQRFQSSMTRTPKTLPSTEQDLARWLSSDVNLRGIGLLEELRENPNTFDAVQLHYLQDAWDLLPEYVNWVKSWFPGKPVEFWEIGYGWPGEETGQPFSEEGHAAGVVKTLVGALGEGASRVIYEPYWEEVKAGADDKAARKFGRGLVTPAGFRLAATAYQTMTGKLSGYQAAQRVDLGEKVWAYRFALPDGEAYVVWASEGRVVTLPAGAPQATVTDIFGNATTADPSTLKIGTSPLFVEFP